MTIATTTFKDVQLVKAGTWGGMTGRSTITPEDLADAVAAYADPEIDRGVLKIGHDGDLNLGTGQPALGWIENLKLSADKQTLIGDLTNVPSKLAAIIPRAFRRRSVEMTLGAKTPSGKTYRAALTGLALLGAKAPAVKGLDDIVALYASEGEPLEGDETVAFAVDGDTDTAPVPHDPGAGGKSGDGSNNPEERSADMALSDALKKKLLGLPETATDAEVEAALTAAEAAVATPAGPEGTPGAATPTGTPAAATGTAAAPAGTPAAPVAPNAAAAPGEPAAGTQLAEGVETVVLTKAVFAELQQGAEAAKLLLAESAAAKKEAALDTAIRAGKIAPAERVAFAAAWDKNADGTAELLNTLAPRFTTIELGELGADHAGNADADDKGLHEQADKLGI